MKNVLLIVLVFFISSASIVNATQSNIGGGSVQIGEQSAYCRAHPSSVVVTVYSTGAYANTCTCTASGGYSCGGGGGGATAAANSGNCSGAGCSATSLSQGFNTPGAFPGYYSGTGGTSISIGSSNPTGSASSKNPSTNLTTTAQSVASIDGNNKPTKASAGAQAEILASVQSNDTKADAPTTSTAAISANSLSVQNAGANTHNQNAPADGKETEAIQWSAIVSLVLSIIALLFVSVWMLVEKLQYNARKKSGDE